jgi:hypothetical protein
MLFQYENNQRQVDGEATQWIEQQINKWTAGVKGGIATPK